MGWGQLDSRIGLDRDRLSLCAGFGLNWDRHWFGLGCRGKAVGLVPLRTADMVRNDLGFALGDGRGAAFARFGMLVSHRIATHHDYEYADKQYQSSHIHLCGCGNLLFIL